MQSACSTDSDNVRRRKRREEMRLHKDLLLQRKIDANRRNYPDLFRIIDSDSFQEWYRACLGREFDIRKAADIEELVLFLNSMQAVYGEIPD